MKDKVIVTFKLETEVLHKDGSAEELCISQIFNDITKTKAYKKHMESGGIYVLISSDSEIAIRRMLEPKGPEDANAIISNNKAVYDVLGVVKKIDVNTETVDVEIPIDKLEKVNTYLDSISSEEIGCHGKIIPAFYSKGYYMENNKYKLRIDDDCYIPYMRLC